MRNLAAKFSGAFAKIAAIFLSLHCHSFCLAQYCDEAFVGDLNDDGYVNNRDLDSWDDLEQSMMYQPCADLNRNGQLDKPDRDQLQFAITLCRPSVLGLGGRIPTFSISELRYENFVDTECIVVPNESYVEFRAPPNFPSFPPTQYIFSNRFEDGYFLVLVEGGIIRQFFNLNAVRFGVSGPTNKLALIVDDTFLQRLPPGTVPDRVEKIGFLNQEITNTSWLLVYRRPPPFGNPKPPPSPGLNVQDPKNPCQILDLCWDLVIDAVAVIANNDSCIYNDGSLYKVGPPGKVGTATFHAYRGCDPDKSFVGQFQNVLTGIDTPFKSNACPGDLYCGSPKAGSCLLARNTPYCDDPICCEYVCDELPDCCVFMWDSRCVNLARAECLTCGGNATDCCDRTHDSPFCNDESCCTLVCNEEPSCCFDSWDDICVDWYYELCLDCGSDLLPNTCFERSSYPNCKDGDCCNQVCQYDDFCCTTVWDASCVNYAEVFCLDLSCGSLGAGDCCLIHDSPYCNDVDCCLTVCALDPFCCGTSWDNQCVTEAITFCPSLSCNCGGGGSQASCFLVHPQPGCSSVYCCSDVCTSDPFCCGVRWDASCVATAQTLCAQNPICENASGGCLVTHTTPGCNVPACCDIVCSEIPSCCELRWDVQCVAKAEQKCQGCGDVFAGSCREAHPPGNPACNDLVCCSLVCQRDEYCCEINWDEVCASYAIDDCIPAAVSCGDADARSCFSASFLKGCSDDRCCALICQRDIFCCEVQWDAICAGEALVFATLQIGCDLPPSSGIGNCLLPHQSTGCADLQCSAVVCEIEELCCINNWDQLCADYASIVCIAVGGCPGQGSPFVPHPTPGSLDSSCCYAVCSDTFLEYCCNVIWDADCVQKANEICLPDSAWNLPCTGSCFSTHSNPGCEDSSCGSAVCSVAPDCCLIKWDVNCVSLARGICCGLPGCGSGCNESCVISHSSPFCDDPYCCTMVCAQDPSCCTSSWDTNCAEFARDRCQQGCGNSVSGTCLLPHAWGGCSNAACCVAVCVADPFCCDSEWDDTCAYAAQVNEACQPTIVGGNPLAGSCCSAHPNNPYCDDLICSDAVCAQDEFCCTYAWDETCANSAFFLCAAHCRKNCGDSCADDCCQIHLGPNCNDAVCCEVVTALDPWCQDVEWDADCVLLARAYCPTVCAPPICGDISSGDCCIAHASASCSNLKCCNLVCASAKFAYCCETDWDEACAEKARSDCPICDLPGCGDAGTGSCFIAHPTPHCELLGCCQTICAVYRPECCTNEWDADCVKFASQFCN